MQILCGLQVVFFLFNCQTPEHFKECMTGQSLLNGSEEKGREIVIHSREMKKAQHTIFSTLAEADLVPVKVELMEPSLESLFLEVIK